MTGFLFDAEKAQTSSSSRPWRQHLVDLGDVVIGDRWRSFSWRRRSSSVI